MTNVFARLPEFKNNRFYSRDFYSKGFKSIRISNNAGCVLSALREYDRKYRIVEFGDKYRRILESHTKNNYMIDGDTISVSGIVFILNGMCRYWKYTSCIIELDIDDCIDNRPDMLIQRTLVYYLMYDSRYGNTRTGTIASCEAITPQKRLVTVADVLEVEKIEKAVV